jgi:hypothetical protein
LPKQIIWLFWLADFNDAFAFHQGRSAVSGNHNSIIDFNGYGNSHKFPLSAFGTAHATPTRQALAGVAVTIAVERSRGLPFFCPVIVVALRVLLGFEAGTFDSRNLGRGAAGGNAKGLGAGEGEA